MAQGSSDKPSGPSRGRRRVVVKRGSRDTNTARHKQSNNKNGRPSSKPVNQRPASTHAAGSMADTSTTFADLGVPRGLVNALRDEGVEHPFPIQAAAIPQAIDGKDILGRGPTGSGKTFTFGVPMVARLIGGASKPKRPRGLVLAPTRELATQIRQRLEPVANAAGQRVLEVVGGIKIQRNVTALARPVDILIATPGRSQDLLNQGFISFEDVQILSLIHI